MCVLWPQWKHCLRQFLQVQLADSPTWSLKHLPVKVFYLPVKVFPFPAVPFSSVALLCPSYTMSGQGAKWPKGPWCALAVVLKAMQRLLFRAWQFCHFFMNLTAASIKGGTPRTQKPGVPRVAFIYQTQVCWADSWWLSSLLAWHLLLLIWLSLSAVLTRSTLKTVFIKLNSQIKQQRSVPCCLIFGPTQARASLHWPVSKPSWIFVSKLRRLIRQIGRLQSEIIEMSLLEKFYPLLDLLLS